MCRHSYVLHYPDGQQHLIAELQLLKAELQKKDEWVRRARTSGKKLQDELAAKSAQLARLEGLSSTGENVENAHLSES